MDIATLTTFFGWCTVVNVGLFTLWIGAWMLMPDYVYKTQVRLFDIPRPQFEAIFYSFLGIFKILFLFFNVVPYLVLLLM